MRVRLRSRVRAWVKSRSRSRSRSRCWSRSRSRVRVRAARLHCLAVVAAVELDHGIRLPHRVEQLLTLRAVGAPRLRVDHHILPPTRAAADT